jgi:hypothetical protein
MDGRKLAGLSLTSTLIAAASLLVAPPAAAGGPAVEEPAPAPAHHKDDFDAFLRGGCGTIPTAFRGAIVFVDHGPGVPDNGQSNDDYIRLTDLCENHHGVKGWAWVDGDLKGSKYNGKGAFKRVIWDPFGDLKGWKYVGLKICEVDGNDDKTPGPCDRRSRWIHG